MIRGKDNPCNCDLIEKTGPGRRSAGTRGLATEEKKGPTEGTCKKKILNRALGIASKFQPNGSGRTKREKRGEIQKDRTLGKIPSDGTEKDRMKTWTGCLAKKKIVIDELGGGIGEEDHVWETSTQNHLQFLRGVNEGKSRNGEGNMKNKSRLCSFPRGIRDQTGTKEQKDNQIKAMLASGQRRGKEGKIIIGVDIIESGGGYVGQINDICQTDARLYLKGGRVGRRLGGHLVTGKEKKFEPLQKKDAGFRPRRKRRAG